MINLVMLSVLFLNLSNAYADAGFDLSGGLNCDCIMGDRKQIGPAVTYPQYVKQAGTYLECPGGVFLVCTSPKEEKTCTKYRGEEIPSSRDLIGLIGINAVLCAK